jgi:hypothetical protein
VLAASAASVTFPCFVPLDGAQRRDPGVERLAILDDRLIGQRSL